MHPTLFLSLERPLERGVGKEGEIARVSVGRRREFEMEGAVLLSSNGALTVAWISPDLNLDLARGSEVLRKFHSHASYFRLLFIKLLKVLKTLLISISLHFLSIANIVVIFN